MYPHLFEHLLTFTEYAVQPPKYGKLETKSLAAAKSKTVSVDLWSLYDMLMSLDIYVTWIQVSII